MSVDHLKEMFQNLMGAHPEAEGEFFASTRTEAHTSIKINSKVVDSKAIDDGESIEDMEEPFHES